MPVVNECGYSVFQMADGRWRCVGKIGLISVTREGKSRDAAVEKWLQAKKKGGPPDPKATLEEICQSYIEKCREKKRAPNTIRDYETCLKRIKAHPIHRVHVTEMTATMVDDFLATMPPATAINTRSFMRAAINRIARKNQLVAENVVEFSDPIERGEDDRAPISFQDYGKVFKSEDDPLLLAYWLVLGAAGMRPDEVRNLQWTELLEDEGGAYLKKAKAKTAKGKKPVPLPQIAAEALKALPRTSIYCFPSNIKRMKGKPFSMTYFTSKWYDAQVRAGVEPTNIYQLRHMFATVMSKMVQEATLADLMRHTDPRTTRRYYRLPDWEGMREASDGLFATPQKPHKNPALN
jgi:integrase